jgi:hypothetical protein
MSGYLLGINIVLLFIAGASANAATADFSGHWQLNPAQSKAGDEKTLSLDIQQNGDTVTLVRTYQGEHDKELKAQFTCTIGGKDCDFDENGHKSKVSLWYDGAALVILKTNGDKRDSTVEWSLHLGDGGKTLSATREIVEPSDSKESLVFNKAESVAAR